jgi:adenylate cyclase
MCSVVHVSLRDALAEAWAETPHVTQSWVVRTEVRKDPWMDSAEPLQDALFEPVLRPERLRRTVSPRDIENAGGLSAKDVIATIRGFGLSVDGPDDPWFTDEEARVFVQLAELVALWPRETYVQISRVYGQALATIARAEVQSVLRNITSELAAERDLRDLRDGLEALIPLADPILGGVHRRWIEHELAQASVFAAEEEEGRVTALGAEHVALLFVDIKGFTAYVDTAGDTAGVVAIEQFDRIVFEEHGETGHVVKALGDGFMLAYPVAVDAVAAGLAMMRRMPREQGPALHASVHAGLALHRGGDYFGRNVNLAARLLGLSGTDEMLATAVVADSTDDRFEWEERSATHIRGFRDPIEIFRLVGPR